MPFFLRHSSNNFPLTGNIPLVCGGVGGSGKCYTYDSTTDSWVGKGSLPKPVGWAGASWHKTLGLIMTGGYYHHSKLSDELVSTPDGENFRKSIKLPYGVGQHCQVLVDAWTLMVFGTGNRAYQIDLRSGKSTTLPTMPGHAQHIACGLGRKKNGSKVAVVTGVGRNNEGTYLFDLQTKKWKIGTKINDLTSPKVP